MFICTWKCLQLHAVLTLGRLRAAIVDNFARAIFNVYFLQILEQVKRALERKEEELEAFDQSQFVEDEEKKRIILNGLISKITDRLKHVFESDHGKDLTICLEKFEMDVMAITKVNTAIFSESVIGLKKLRDSKEKLPFWNMSIFFGIFYQDFVVY